MSTCTYTGPSLGPGTCTCTLGCSDFDLFWESREYQGRNGCQIYSKTCLEKAFFHILSPFMRVKLQNFKIMLNRAHKMLFLKKQVGISKIAEFYAKFKSVEKVSWKSTQRSQKPKTLMLSSKSWKSQFFLSFLVIIFLGEFLWNFLNEFELSVKFWFLYPNLILKEKKNLGPI